MGPLVARDPDPRIGLEPDETWKLVRVRKADSEDAEAIATLGSSTFLETYGNHNEPKNLISYIFTSFSAAQIRSELGSAGESFFLAEGPATGGPVGYSKLREAAPSGSCPLPAVELQRLYVVRDWIGTGIGAALMDHCMREAADRGARILWLGVDQQNHQALTFYERWGFTVTGEQVFRLGSDQQTDLVMQRSLSNS